MASSPDRGGTEEQELYAATARMPRALDRVQRAFHEGLRRVASAPAVLGSVFMLMFLLALPLALILRGAIEAHLGSSLEAGAAADGVNYGWWQEFRNQAGGLSTSFAPAIIGFGPVLDNISRVLDYRSAIAPIVWLLAATLVVWTFVLGGVIDRYARQRPTRVHGFFGASGVFFFRFLRLTVVAAAIYWFLFEYVHAWLFDEWYESAIRDVDSERAAFAWRLLMYAIFAALVTTANLILDYAKIRAVVEDRRSMVGALGASIRFIWRHRTAVVGLHLLDALAFATLIALWALVAPGVGGAGAGMWFRFAAGQAYILARVFLKLQFLASQTALFQSLLAHAHYTAAPVPSWPPSPAVEAILRREPS